MPAVITFLVHTGTAWRAALTQVILAAQELRCAGSAGVKARILRQFRRQHELAEGIGFQLMIQNPIQGYTNHPHAACNMAGGLLGGASNNRPAMLVGCCAPCPTHSQQATSIVYQIDHYCCADHTIANHTITVHCCGQWRHCSHHILIYLVMCTVYSFH